jgi:hypothetical protein
MSTKRLGHRQITSALAAELVSDVERLFANERGQATFWPAVEQTLRDELHDARKALVKAVFQIVDAHKREMAGG